MTTPMSTEDIVRGLDEALKHTDMNRPESLQAWHEALYYVRVHHYKYDAPFDTSQRSHEEDIKYIIAYLTGMTAGDENSPVGSRALVLIGRIAEYMTHAATAHKARKRGEEKMDATPADAGAVRAKPVKLRKKGRR